MGKKIKVKKEPSDFLLKLIDEANDAIRTAQITMKEKLLYVYNQAVEEGYSPKGARKIMQEKIVGVSDKYVVEVLPVEAKQSHSRRDIKALTDDTNKDLHSGEPKGETINTTLETATLETQTPTITLGATQEDIDEINKIKEGDEDEDTSSRTIIETPLEEKMTVLSHENFKLEELTQVLQRDFDLSQQLLKEERIKTSELTERIELIQQEHEAEVAELKDKLHEEHSLNEKISAQLQEKSRQLTSLTMQFDNAIPEPTPEQNYSIEADVPYNGKKIPVIVRCYISGKKIGWIDREAYKARYGREPQEE